MNIIRYWHSGDYDKSSFMLHKEFIEAYPYAPSPNSTDFHFVFDNEQDMADYLTKNRFFTICDGNKIYHDSFVNDDGQGMFREIDDSELAMLMLAH